MGNPGGDVLHGLGQSFQRLVREVIAFEAAEKGLDHHAYFTGTDEPYKKLKRALRADIDEASSEASSSSLYSKVSRPFDKLKTGKIAIKVINHYEDEELKVFSMTAS
jgi:hypothetical protein